MMPSENSGSRVLVTGAASGIGLAVAKAFSTSARLALAAWGNADNLGDLRSRMSDNTLFIREVDVTDGRAVESFVADSAAKFGGVDVVVTCAGVHHASPSHAVTSVDWDDVVSVNLTGTFNVIRAALPYMLDQRWGRVITIASELGLTGQSENAAYCASKGGVIALTKALAREYAADNILVNCVAPGPVITDMLRASQEYKDGSALAGMPIGRYGEPKEIADAVMFLATSGSFCVGQVLSPNGGAVI